MKLLLSFSLFARASAVNQADMDGLAVAFCGAAVAISKAFWTNGGAHVTEPEPYPEAACQGAYNETMGALNGAYNYPDPVLFKPTLTTGPYTFRPTIQGAASYFIGTECLQMVGTPEDQFPAGNTDGSTFKEYGFALANYGTHKDGTQYEGFSDCKWTGDSYVEGDTMGVAQGKVCFERTEGVTSCVDKTFSFGNDASGGVVITGHHSSAEIAPCSSTQIVFDGQRLEEDGCPTTERVDEGGEHLSAGGEDDHEGDHDHENEDAGTSKPGTEAPTGSDGRARKLATGLATALPAFFLGMMQN